MFSQVSFTRVKSIWVVLNCGLACQTEGFVPSVSVSVLRHHRDATGCYTGVHGSDLASGATGTPPCWKIVCQDSLSPRQINLANHIPGKQWHPTFNREINFVRQKGIISPPYSAGIVACLMLLCSPSHIRFMMSVYRIECWIMGEVLLCSILCLKCNESEKNEGNNMWTKKQRELMFQGSQGFDFASTPVQLSPHVQAFPFFLTPIQNH